MFSECIEWGFAGPHPVLLRGGSTAQEGAPLSRGMSRSRGGVGVGNAPKDCTRIVARTQRRIE
jgi:hypothetical protein